LYGPTGIQAVISGQAAVGVVVSAIQLLSAAASIGAPSSPASITRSDNEEDAEVKSAFVFFGISTVYMLCSMGAYRWMKRTPTYKALVGPLEQQRKVSRRLSIASESQALVSGVSSSPSKDGQGRIWRVAKSNATFNFALAYVFIVTLVGRLLASSSLLVPYIVNSGRFPAHNRLHPPNESNRPPPPFQCIPLPCIQRR